MYFFDLQTGRDLEIKVTQREPGELGSESPSPILSIPGEIRKGEIPFDVKSGGML